MVVIRSFHLCIEDSLMFFFLSCYWMYWSDCTVAVEVLVCLLFDPRARCIKLCVPAHRAPVCICILYFLPISAHRVVVWEAVIRYGLNSSWLTSNRVVVNRHSSLEIVSGIVHPQGNYCLYVLFVCVTTEITRVCPTSQIWVNCVSLSLFSFSLFPFLNHISLSLLYFSLCFCL